LDDVYPHWQRLTVLGEEVDENFSTVEEWNAIQERLERTPYKMKLHIKQAMHQLGFLEDTMLPPPPRNVVTKETPKRVRSTPKSISTGLFPLGGSVLILKILLVNPHNPRLNLQRGKVHVLALSPAHKLRRLLHSLFRMYHTLQKCQ